MMLRVDPAALADYLEEADQRRVRLKGQKSFRGIVTAVDASAFPKVTVEVAKTGESQSSQHAHAVTSTWDPQIGDQANIHWQDEQSAIATPIDSALSRMPARHPYWWHVHNSSSPGLAAGWVPIVYGIVDDDPSGVYGSGIVTVPVDGTYVVIVRGATTANLDMTCGLWKNGSQIDQGDYSNSQRGSVCPVVRRFLKGDQLIGYVWTSAGGTLDGASPFQNVFQGCLQSRG